MADQDYRAMVERLSHQAVTIYSNVSYVTAGGGFARIVLGDQYGPEPVMRASYLMTLADAERLALVILEQIDAARLREAPAATGGSDVQPR